MERALGMRQRRRWEGNIKTDLREVSFGDMNRIELTYYRIQF